MNWQITVRHGGRRQRYDSYAVQGGDLRDALLRAAEIVPEDVARGADLVEIRVAPDPDARRYLGEDEG